MEWKNYERKIVCGLGYKLVGWPSNLPITNGIDNLSEPALRDIAGQLRIETIFWEVVTESEIEKLKKTAPALPQRSDKGQKRKQYNLRSGSNGEALSALYIMSVSP